MKIIQRAKFFAGQQGAIEKQTYERISVGNHVRKLDDMLREIGNHGGVCEPAIIEVNGIRFEATPRSTADAQFINRAMEQEINGRFG